MYGVGDHCSTIELRSFGDNRHEELSYDRTDCLFTKRGSVVNETNENQLLLYFNLNNLSSQNNGRLPIKLRLPLYS